MKVGNRYVTLVHPDIRLGRRKDSSMGHGRG